MMKGFEHRRQPLVSRKIFLGKGCPISWFLHCHHRHLARHRHSWLPLFEHMSWLDALLNASMILGGMGPVDPVRTDAGKLFASFYALFSGVVFLVAVGVFIAPIFHRFLHAFHVAAEDIDESKRDKVPGRKR